MSILDLVDRLLKCRPMVFYGPADSYLLMDGKTQGTGGFEQVGHSSESSKLSFLQLMTYDEMKLSALISVSSQSVFINSGSRHNRGIPQSSGNFSSDGVIIGQIGARFEKPGLMEWQDCMITRDQNTSENGYGDLDFKDLSKKSLIKFWGCLWSEGPFPTFSEAKKTPEDFNSVSPDLLFNKKIYKARIRMVADILLAEAISRAKKHEKVAYIHVVGLGLGVWKITSLQTEVYVTAFGEALQNCKETEYISDINFSWISAKECCGTKSGEEFPNTKVKIHFSKRDLHDKVPEGCLLVCNFAWDSNSLPGNEFWLNMLSASGDPAAACSSSIAELHNHAINPLITSSNLHVATVDKGVMHISQYAKFKLAELNKN